MLGLKKNEIYFNDLTINIYNRLKKIKQIKSYLSFWGRLAMEEELLCQYQQVYQQKKVEK